MAKIPWRRWNNVLHRDIGYLIVALTVAYAISGLAVNHTADWNPSYAKSEKTFTVEPITATERDSVVAQARERIGRTDEPRNTFRPDPETVQLFYGDYTYSIDCPTGTVLAEETRERPVLFEVNQLHLNAPKGIWTYIADLYAVTLIIVALTGLFVLKGKNGITGRGAWLTAGGVAVPVAYWLYYLYV